MVGIGLGYFLVIAFFGHVYSVLYSMLKCFKITDDVAGAWWYHTHTNTQILCTVTKTLFC